MVRQAEDNRTREMFGDGERGTRISGSGRIDGRDRASEAARQFAARRKVFPEMTHEIVCELCGKKHEGVCG